MVKSLFSLINSMLDLVFGMNRVHNIVFLLVYKISWQRGFNVLDNVEDYFNFESRDYEFFHKGVFQHLEVPEFSGFFFSVGQGLLTWGVTKKHCHNCQKALLTRTTMNQDWGHFD